jgi:hypothetical protein
MGTKYYAIAALLMVLVCVQVNAQTLRESNERIINSLMEKLVENTESTVDYTDLEEQLKYYITHKLNLNKATREQLERLFFLGEGQINAIISHRVLYGGFLSLYELQSIAVLDDLTIYYLTYFVTTDENWQGDQATFTGMIRQGKHEISALSDTEFQPRSGYSPQRKNQGRTYYPGNQWREVLRYRFSYGNRLTFGYTGEKDMGEQFAAGAQRYGFDFNSFHFSYRPRKGILKSIVLGDYQASFGQGLTFGSGMASRKSAFVLNVRRNFIPLRPYRSLNENEFLRGGAVALERQNIHLILFGSARYISTNFQADTLEDDDLFSSISVSGLHRTEAEVAKRNNVLQQVYGGYAKYQLKNGHIGFTHIAGFYDKHFEPGNKPYQRYNVSGQQLSSTGADYNLQWRNAGFSGEFSRSSNNAFSFISAFVVSLDVNFDVAFLYRNYAKNYRTVFSNAFGEYSDNRNEHGIYTGAAWRFSRKWTINAYLDLYQSKWLRYLTDGPSHGSDFLAELQYNPSKSTLFYMRYRQETAWKNQPDNTTASDYLSAQAKTIYRLNAQYRVSLNLTAKSRIETTMYSDEVSKNQTGVLLFQDLAWSTPGRMLTFTIRAAYFTVDDYSARIYAAENDVPYQYSVPLYQNSGTRYYVVARFRINRKVEFWFKLSETIYSNVQTIGSGLEEINGNRLSDLRLMLKVVL